MISEESALAVWSLSLSPHLPEASASTLFHAVCYYICAIVMSNTIQVVAAPYNFHSRNVMLQFR